jgi:hypothetical protein
MGKIVGAAILLMACSNPKPAAFCSQEAGELKKCRYTETECKRDGVQCTPIPEAWVAKWIDQHGEHKEVIAPVNADCKEIEDYTKSAGFTYLGCSRLVP